MVASRRLVELDPDPKFGGLGLQVRIVETLECGHELRHFTDGYQPRPRRRCSECVGQPKAQF